MNLSPGALLGSFVVAMSANAQELTATDRSLSSSLLAVSFPAPSAPVWPADSVRTNRPRYEIAYGRAFRATAGGLRQTVVIHTRSEQRGPRSSDESSGVGGIRLGLRADERTGRPLVSSAEVYMGGRAIAVEGVPASPAAGIDFVAGWGGFGEDTRASFATRIPIERVFQSASARFTIFAVPAFGWGNLRFRACEDRGPGDNCGDLGIQLAFGRTRFVLGGGASLTLLPSRLSISAGVQRLFAVGETERAWLGAAWTR